MVVFVIKIKMFDPVLFLNNYNLICKTKFINKTSTLEFRYGFFFAIFCPTSGRYEKLHHHVQHYYFFFIEKSCLFQKRKENKKQTNLKQSESKCLSLNGGCYNHHHSSL